MKNQGRGFDPHRPYQSHAAKELRATQVSKTRFSQQLISADQVGSGVRIHASQYISAHHLLQASPVLHRRGKTAVATIVRKFIPDDEWIVLTEDTAKIQKPNVLRSEARREQNGVPAVTNRDLLRATRRHRPDRIILGEIRGGEAFDLLQLLNTGHSGTLSTVHANSAAQGIVRFATCVLQSGVELPYRAIKSNIAGSLNILVQIERRPGTRFVSEVLELRDCDAEKDRYQTYPVYERVKTVESSPH